VVGAGSAVLAVINATFVRPLPFADEGRLLSIYSLPPGSQSTTGGAPLSSNAYVRLRESLRAIESLAGFWPRDRTLLVNGAGELIATAGVSPDYFHVLGIPLAAGRMFTPEEETAAARVAVISQAFATQALGSGSPIGARVVIDGDQFEVIGVLPAVTEQAYVGADVYTPLGIRRGNEPVPGSTIVQAVARLRPGRTLAQARTEVEAEMRRVVEELPSTHSGWSAGAVPVREGLFGDTLPALTVLLVAVCLLTAIASVNLANVTLAQMISRRDEITLRTALGARRAELVRLIAMEHVLLALAGGAAGLLLARVALPAILALDAGTAAALGDVTVDWRVQAGTFALALGVSLVSGLLPALMATRGDLARGLAQSGKRLTLSKRQARARSWLVALETTIATVLLVTGALLLTGFSRTAAEAPGFDPANVIGAQIRLPIASYPSHDHRATFVRRVVEELRAVPGVESASAAFNTFQGGGYFTTIHIEGRPTPDGQPRTVQFRRASPGYFETMKIAMLRGRAFEDADTAGSMPVVVVSRQLSELVWPGEDPIGRRVIRPSDPTRPITVIGIADDVRDRGLDLPTAPTIYLAYAQNTNPAAPISLVARTTSDPASYRRAIGDALHRVDPALPLSGITTLESFLSNSLGPRRFRSVLLLVFAALGLVLAVIGIYGVTARGVVERTRELGIRLALGSGRAQLWRLVLRQSLTAVAVGFAIGVPASILAGLALTRTVAGTSLSDLWLAVPTGFVLALSGALGAAVPTLRAVRIDALVALRSE
jgi:putative ABC transport system permease protein